MATSTFPKSPRWEIFEIPEVTLLPAFSLNSPSQGLPLHFVFLINYYYYYFQNVQFHLVFLDEVEVVASYAPS